jgi:hypothetical protein
VATHLLTGAKAGWVAYAALLTFGVLAGEAANLSRGGEFTALTLANWTLSAALLIALWGYALQRRIGNERYWRAVFWLVVFANAAMLVPVILGDRTLAMFVAVLTALIVPAYVAAYFYAYRSSALWTRPAH